MICQEREILFLRHKPPTRTHPAQATAWFYFIFAALNSLISFPKGADRALPPEPRQKVRGNRQKYSEQNRNRAVRRSSYRMANPDQQEDY
jgi:hypothetical protein